MCKHIKELTSVQAVNIKLSTDGNYYVRRSSTQTSIAADSGLNALSVTCLILESSKRRLLGFSRHCGTMLTPQNQGIPKTKALSFWFASTSSHRGTYIPQSFFSSIFQTPVPSKILHVVWSCIMYFRILSILISKLFSWKYPAVLECPHQNPDLAALWCLLNKANKKKKEEGGSIHDDTKVS